MFKYITDESAHFIYTFIITQPSGGIVTGYTDAYLELSKKIAQHYNISDDERIDRVTWASNKNNTIYVISVDKVPVATMYRNNYADVLKFITDKEDSPNKTCKILCKNMYEITVYYDGGHHQITSNPKEEELHYISIPYGSDVSDIGYTYRFTDFDKFIKECGKDIDILTDFYNNQIAGFILESVADAETCFISKEKFTEAVINYYTEPVDADDYTISELASQLTTTEFNEFMKDNLKKEI